MNSSGEEAPRLFRAFTLRSHFLRTSAHPTFLFDRSQVFPLILFAMRRSPVLFIAFSGILPDSSSSGRFFLHFTASFSSLRGLRSHFLGGPRLPAPLAFVPIVSLSCFALRSASVITRIAYCWPVGATMFRKVCSICGRICIAAVVVFGVVVVRATSTAGAGPTSGSAALTFNSRFVGVA